MSIRSAWDRIALSGQHTHGYMALRVSGPAEPALYAARRNADGREALLLEVPTQALPAEADFPSSMGFEITPHVIDPGPRGTVLLSLLLRDVHFHDVFVALAEDVAGRLSGILAPATAVQALLDRLSCWQTFLRKHGPQGPAPEARRGLFGELWILDWLLDVVAPNCWPVDCWRGPAEATHDFQLPTVSLEIKTTTAAPPHQVHISNLMQLDDAGLPALMLGIVHVEESLNATVSLPDLVCKIRTRVGAQRRDALEDALLRAGYSDALLALLSKPRYSVHGVAWFRVLQGFPRLLVADVPAGIVDVRYGIALGACSSYARTPGEVKAIVLGNPV